MQLDGVVEVIENPDGTAHSFRNKGSKFAGKTGTAEIKKSKEDTGGMENGWFVAFPADESYKRQYLVVAMVEDVKDRCGSKYVVPKVRAIFTN